MERWCWCVNKCGHFDMWFDSYFHTQVTFKSHQQYVYGIIYDRTWYGGTMLCL